MMTNTLKNTGAAPPPNSQRLQLNNHLKLIEDLWQKLYYVKWNPKSFAMLARLAQEMLRNVQGHSDARLSNLVTELEAQIKRNLAHSALPPDSDRQRINSLLDALRFTLAANNNALDEEPRTRPLLSTQLELFFITPDKNPPLLTRLKDAGYRVQHLGDLAETEQRLHERRPVALILDMDFPQGATDFLSMISRLRTETNKRLPILFLAERNDVAARLEAVEAGSIAYFNKPFDSDEVVSALREWLLPQTSADHYRVLIVNDRPAEAWEMAGAFEENGITPRVVIQPLQVLQDIHRFRPDLLLIDLDLEVGGAQLVQVIAQHRDLETLPILIMCFPNDATNYLDGIDAPGANLIMKPASIKHLCWEVKQRLRRGRTLRVKMGQLTNNDAVSGLLNRGHFMVVLERELEAIGVRLQSLTLIFIMLDNLRAIRDSAGVATADEVIGQAAARLRAALNIQQPAARFSDAIIAILAPNLPGDAPVQLARRLRDTLETGFYQVGEHALLLQTHIGIASTNDRSQDHLTLVQRADAACGLARESKDERIYVQQNVKPVAENREPSSRQQIVDQVRESIEQERLWLVFQPVVSMHGNASERYEALLRLRDNQGQEIPPGNVFGVIANHQIGIALDRWVIAHALETLRQRQQPTTLFIKILPETFRDKTMAGWLRERLESSGVAARSLVFQIPEPMVKQHLRDMFSFLGSIKMLGCGFCLDRFGGGRAADSLNMLKNLGADYVKLDMQWMDNLSRNSKKQEQLKELVENLAALGTETIVCGVEDVQVMPILWSLGIDLMQGFFVQQPYREMSYDFTGSAF